MRTKCPHMKQSALFLFFILAIASVHGAPIPDQGNATIIPAALRSATVYRKGAELVHTATARLVQGNNDLVISEVSNTIDPASIRIRCSGNVTIMSVAFSTDYLKTPTAAPFIKKWQDSIALIKKELARLDALTGSVNEQIDLLNANKNISGATTGVTVADLDKMLDYYRQKVLDLRTEGNGYQDRSAQLKEQQGKLENQIREETNKNDKTGGCLVLQLLSPQTGPCDLTISYLTPSAHWDRPT